MPESRSAFSRSAFIRSGPDRSGYIFVRVEEDRIFGAWLPTEFVDESFALFE
jgi:hypothetical protein